MRESGHAGERLCGVCAEVNYYLPLDIRDAFLGRSVLVTGSEGFLGKHFQSALTDCGAHVIGWDIKTGHDVSMPPSIFTRVHYIIHGAGLASPYHYRRSPLVALDAAVAGTRNMVDLAERSGAKLVFLSSSEIYGDPHVVPTPETYRSHVETMGDRSSYDVSKCLGETLVHLAAQRGVAANVVRIFNAFGPGMSDDDRRFMPNLRRAKRQGETMRLYGDGNQTRTFCFVSDTIRGVLLALIRGASGRAYNIGNDGPELSMSDVCKLAGVETERIPYPPEWPGEGEPMRRCPDISRARGELGYSPIVEFESGLESFLQS